MRLICSVLLFGKSSFSRACTVKFSLAPKLRTKRAYVSCFSTSRSSSGKCTPYHSLIRPMNKFRLLSKSSSVWMACPTIRSRFWVAPLTWTLATSTLTLRVQRLSSFASFAKPASIATCCMPSWSFWVSWVLAASAVTPSFVCASFATFWFSKTKVS